MVETLVPGVSRLVVIVDHTPEQSRGQDISGSGFRHDGARFPWLCHNSTDRWSAEPRAIQGPSEGLDGGSKKSYDRRLWWDRVIPDLSRSLMLGGTAN
jgi:hypothetical protein